MKHLWILLAGVAFAASPAWKVEYEVRGAPGYSPHRIVVTEDGNVTIFFAGTQVHLQATADEKLAIDTALQNLQLAKQPTQLSGQPPDRTLNVIYDGRSYAVGSSSTRLLATLDSLLQRGLPQPGPPPASWRVDYAYSGGIANKSERITVAEDGSVTVTLGSYHTAEANFRATPEEVARITGALWRFDLSGPPRPLPPSKPIPDAPGASLKVTIGGLEYPLDPRNSELVAVVLPLMSRGRELVADQKWTQAGPFRPGRTWTVQIEVRDAKGVFHGEYWNGVWTRRGNGNVFDAVWRDSRTNQQLMDTVEIASAERGHIVLQRSTGNQRLEGTYLPERFDQVSGIVVSQEVQGCTSCAGPAWKAAIQY